MHDLPIFEEHEKMPYMIEISEIPDLNSDGATDLSDIELLLRSNNNVLTLLDGDGDFRSEECIGFLQEADIVVTNPPFSLFRQYVAQLIEYGKKFIILGNNNAITYKEIFSLIKANQIWLGYSANKTFEFRLNESYSRWDRIDNGIKYGKVPAITWYTNLDIEKRHEMLILYRKYKADEYRRYENYDAINIDRVADIPLDFNGSMGVPITFLDKYNPEQFSLIGLGISSSGLEIGVKPYKKEHKIYRKEVQHRGAVDGDLYMLDGNGHPDVPYARIIIKRKDQNENTAA